MSYDTKVGDTCEMKKKKKPYGLNWTYNYKLRVFMYLFPDLLEEQLGIATT